MQRTICTFDVNEDTKHELEGLNNKYTCSCVIGSIDRSASREYFVTRDLVVLETKVLDWQLVTEWPKPPMLTIIPERELVPGHYYFVALGDIVEVTTYDEPTINSGTNSEEN